MLLSFILLGLLAGAVVPFQTSINTRLSHYTQSTFYASTISFFVGTLCLIFLTAVLHPYAFTSSYWNTVTINETWFIGGVMGVLFLTGNLLLLPKIGASLTVITTITGQIFMGCLIDTFGWFYVTPQPFTIVKGIGLLLLLLGIILMNLQRRHAMYKQSDRSLVFWIIIGLIFGCAPPIQAATNSALGQAVGSPIFASLISFSVGTLTLLVITTVFHRRFHITRTHETYGPLKWWVFIGGALGVIFVTTIIVLTAQIGVTYTLVAVMIGQIITSLAIDHFGLLGIPARKISQQRLFGLIVIILAVTLIQFA
ncbi:MULTISPECIES: DMT family transporter [unclassified Staphylococcus]|uniref:DMT family transporter n=1 Tax=unclassified Staphylococcus TaxID=91994 RepID=UPI0021CF7FE4|nr:MULTISPECIES: DMT family transporter [unclassified Staphylococcus]UXR78641.1 DMT family transporter [Staphylococcus sp. IVB6227]UXR82800.1 DMT family transporter [Staphylococcus sp. IVB6214]